MLSRLHVDGFILAILAAVGVATVLPARGTAADVMSWVVVGAIALLFFLYGTRIHPREALAGLTHWRLHLLILAFTFVVFPLVGLALMPVAPHVLGSDLYRGVLFLCLVPSTVQSSIAFTSIARGNVPGAIVSASASNLLGVILTPLLVVALLDDSGGISISPASIGQIVAQILVPFVLGQLARPLVGGVITRHPATTRLVDRGSIVLVVYTAFSDGVREHIWSAVRWWQVVVVVAGSVVLVAALLALTGWVATRLRFRPADVIAVQFCGTKKSLATGLPMAAVLFSGQQLGLIVLPLLVFHQVQLMMCVWYASRLARRPVETEPAPATSSGGDSRRASPR